MNSRNKGKVGEREFAALLRSEGFDARRGQQFSGSAESPDVVCPALPWLHIEVKRVQALNLVSACAQAEGDCQGKPWIVAHRRNHAPWMITMRAEVFFALLRGALPPNGGENGEVGGAKGELRPENSEVRTGGRPAEAPVIAKNGRETIAYGQHLNGARGDARPPDDERISAGACAAAGLTNPSNNNNENAGTAK